MKGKKKEFQELLEYLSNYAMSKKLALRSIDPRLFHFIDFNDSIPALPSQLYQEYEKEVLGVTHHDSERLKSSGVRRRVPFEASTHVDLAILSPEERKNAVDQHLSAMRKHQEVADFLSDLQQRLCHTEKELAKSKLIRILDKVNLFFFFFQE